MVNYLEKNFLVHCIRGKDYEIVDFLKLDPKLFSLLDKRENGFGGYGAEIRYCGKKLYVKYGKRQCRRGIIRWDSNNYSISVNLTEFDEYFDKAYELDSFFIEEFGSMFYPTMWSPIVRGDTFGVLDFKIPVDGEYSETVFFGKPCSCVLDGSVPKMSNIRVLARWDRVSMGYGYGAVIRPRAIQISVVDVIKEDIDDDTPEVFPSDEVLRFF